MNAANPIALAEWLMECMRQYFERDGHLDPVAAVLATRDHKTGEKAARLVRYVAERAKTCAIVCGFEMWVVRSEDEQTLERAAEMGSRTARARTARRSSTAASTRGKRASRPYRVRARGRDGLQGVREAPP
jgi:hypothetical protein